MNESDIPKLSDAVRASFEPVMRALGPVRQALADQKDVVAIRPGYKYPPGSEPVPGIVVAVTPGTSPVNAADLESKFGVAFTVIEATVEEQMAAADRGPVSFGVPEGPTVSSFETLLGGDIVVFLPPKTGSYQEPDPPNLPLVNEKMDLTVCVSPEAGWSELEDFLGETKSRLT